MRIVTLVFPRASGSLTPSLLGLARDAAAGGPPTWLSPGEAAEFATDAPDAAAIRAAIRAALGDAPVDVLLTRPRGRRKALLVADMDSTIVEGETLDELAAQAGIGDRVAAITARSMNGELDFADALRERVALLRGLPLAALAPVRDAIRLSPGARTLVRTMRAHNALTALVSGGFTAFTAGVAAACGFERHHANVLLDDGASLTGAVAEPILGREAKLERLQALAAERGLRLAATLAVGDGANDLAMLGAAGLGVAWRAKPVVAAACANRIEHADLRALLFAQGYPAGAFRDE